MINMSAESFVAKRIETLKPKHQAGVREYIRFAKENGARMCNDGYPDARFKGTYKPEHMKARQYISRVRNAYKYECLQAQREVYIVAGQAIAQGFVDQMKAMFEENK